MALSIEADQTQEDESGYDESGYDESGYDESGYDESGINESGYTIIQQNTVDSFDHSEITGAYANTTGTSTKIDGASYYAVKVNTYDNITHKYEIKTAYITSYNTAKSTSKTEVLARNSIKNETYILGSSGEMILG